MDDEPTPRELLFIHVGDIQLGYKQNVTEDREETLGIKHICRSRGGRCCAAPNLVVDVR